MQAQWREFGVERFRQALDRELGRRIDAEAGAGAIATNRRDVEDAARPLCAHRRQHGAGDIEQPEDIGAIVSHQPNVEEKSRS
jgi:hypothetical protein